MAEGLINGCTAEQIAEGQALRDAYFKGLDGVLPSGKTVAEERAAFLERESAAYEAQQKLTAEAAQRSKGVTANGNAMGEVASGDRPTTSKKLGG